MSPRIGLFGGSFDPPHAGHVFVAYTAYKEANLHSVWWIPCISNHLKDKPLFSITERTKMIHDIEMHLRYKICKVGKALSHHSTFTTMSVIKRLHGSNFVWIMGSDCWADLHRWYRWKDLLRSMPIIVVHRRYENLSNVLIMRNVIYGKTGSYCRKFMCKSLNMLKNNSNGWYYIRKYGTNESSTRIKDRVDEEKK